MGRQIDSALEEDVRLRLTRLLGQVLGEEPAGPYSMTGFKSRVRRFLRSHDCWARPRFVDTPDRMQRWILRYALLMAQQTYWRQIQPAPLPDPELVRRFEELLPPPPGCSSQYSQARVDAASSLRRAGEVHATLGGKGKVAFLGDDDATSVAFSLLGGYDITAVDIDQRVLDWLAQAGQPMHLEQVDLRRVPEHMADSFEAVVLDPVRDAFLGGVFLKAAATCLKPGGWLFWADHPDWNPGYARMESTARRLGFTLDRVHEAWHVYQAEHQDNSTAERFGLDPEWLRKLAENVQLWSNLYVYRLESK